MYPTTTERGDLFRLDVQAWPAATDTHRRTIRKPAGSRSFTRRPLASQALVALSQDNTSQPIYILNRDAAANLTIWSPLEAHKNNAIIHHIVGVDVGFENPMYAALEVEYTEADQDPTGEAYGEGASSVCPGFEVI